MLEKFKFFIKDPEELLIALVVVLILSFIVYIKYNYAKWHKEKLQESNAELLESNNSLTADNLKFQLQPHTLKNILATLNTLSSRLNNGMVSLSGILEYIIYQDSTDLVSIEDEIEFIQKYITLNEQFTDEIETMRLDLSKVDKTVLHYREPSIPHLISAYFIENAFKHGDKSQQDFLSIQVLLTEEQFELIVKNRIKIKSVTKKPGIGLKNMHARMDVLFPEKYEMKQSCDEEYYISNLKILF